MKISLMTLILLACFLKLMPTVIIVSWVFLQSTRGLFTLHHANLIAQLHCLMSYVSMYFVVESNILCMYTYNVVITCVVSFSLVVSHSLQESRRCYYRCTYSSTAITNESSVFTFEGITKGNVYV